MWLPDFLVVAAIDGTYTNVKFKVYVLNFCLARRNLLIKGLKSPSFFPTQQLKISNISVHCTPI